MKKIIVILLLLAGNVIGAELSDVQVKKIADAIFKAEGGYNTKYLYGIVSIPIKGNTQLAREAYARRICINTIKHKFSDWNALGATGDYIDYLGSKYSPINSKNDPQGLNRNWVKNVKSILKN